MIRRILRYTFWVLLAIVGVAMIYGWSLYRNIRSLAGKDEAHAADAIVVLGAAQYNGHPSPVLKQGSITHSISTSAAMHAPSSPPEVMAWIPIFRRRMWELNT